MKTFHNIIHPDDDMFCGNISHYEAVGRQFAELIQHASKFLADPPEKILELPCGYGRVTRHLCNIFPANKILVADAMKKAVMFCCTNFGVTGVTVNEPLNEFRSIADENFHISAMGSLITHLDERSSLSILRHFLSKLSEGGIAVITSHGKRANEILFSNAGWFELLPQDIIHLKECALQDQYGYVRYAPEHTFEKKTVDQLGRSYGISLIPHNWMLSILDQLGYVVIEYQEGGWDNHQDVFFIKRKRR
jgi:ubiquinone/menaquinone biosynthesis C-methylase UbiE